MMKLFGWFKASSGSDRGPCRKKEPSRDLDQETPLHPVFAVTELIKSGPGINVETAGEQLQKMHSKSLKLLDQRTVTLHGPDRSNPRPYLICPNGVAIAMAPDLTATISIEFGRTGVLSVRRDNWDLHSNSDQRPELKRYEDEIFVYNSVKSNHEIIFRDNSTSVKFKGFLSKTMYLRANRTAHINLKELAPHNKEGKKAKKVSVGMRLSQNADSYQFKKEIKSTYRNSGSVRGQNLFDKIRHIPGVVAARDEITEETPTKYRHKVFFDYGEQGDLGSLVGQDRARTLMIMHQVLDTFREIHANGIVYGDAKLANIVATKRNGYFETWLIDFDTMGYHGEETNLLTEAYCAPEIFAFKQVEREDKRYRHDAFALGVAFFKLHFGHYPFFCGCPKEERIHWMSSPLMKATEIKCGVSKDPMASIIFGLLDPDPTKRISVQSAFKRLEPLVGELDPEQPFMIAANKRKQRAAMDKIERFDPSEPDAPQEELRVLFNEHEKPWEAAA